MKTVLISIRPKWWNLILEGKKTIEVRKSGPKDIEFPFKVVCYVTGEGIVGQFMCDFISITNSYSSLTDFSQLTAEEISEYANGKTGRRKREMKDGFVHAWKIKEGSAVKYDRTFKITDAGLDRPPQSWCYIPTFTQNKVAYSFDGESYGCDYDNTAEAFVDIYAEIEGEKNIPPKVYIGECNFFRPSLSGSGWDPIEAVIEQADDEGFGEWDDGYLDDVTPEQRDELAEELDAVFQKWIEKHNLESSFYSVNAFDIYTYCPEKKKYLLYPEE
jgi:predicted transcriptional regulator